LPAAVGCGIKTRAAIVGDFAVGVEIDQQNVRVLRYQLNHRPRHGHAQAM